ncbi:hypothetical protein [Pseudonocardia nigra]|uniref:hypothetical protein n=1 Tax=Pseudonocardia nigra TaxID=1921578 RepID=UPI001C5E23DC|nr:hypothetical protein [Pseudonocardia nigra]
MTRKTLIALTIAEVAALVGVLAGYLVTIARRLAHVSTTLGKITFGVRAIETQTASIGPALSATNSSLEQVARRLEESGS